MVTVTPTATNFVIVGSEVYPSKPSVLLDGKKRTELRTISVTGSRFGLATENNCGIIMTNRVCPSLGGSTYIDGVAVRVKYM